MRNELIAERRSLDCINRTSHRSQSSFSTLLFLMTVLIFNCCLVSVEGQGNSNPVFDGVQRDDEIAIRDAIQKDPSSIDTKGVGGQTPLIHAVLTGKLTAVKTLIDLGADMTATEKDGYNILHAAGFQGRDAILQYLLSSDKVKSAGLDPKADQHSDGYYPLHRACWGYVMYTSIESIVRAIN